MSTKKELLDCENDIDRFYAQTDGIIVALTNGSPDYFDGVQSSVIMDVLWLIQNRLEDMKSKADMVIAIAKENVNRTENTEAV